MQEKIKISSIRYDISINEKSFLEINFFRISNRIFLFKDFRKIWLRFLQCVTSNNYM